MKLTKTNTNSRLFSKPVVQGSMGSIVKKKVDAPKRKTADKSIEARADRAEDDLRRVGNCFMYTSKEDAQDIMDRLEMSFNRLRRNFKKTYEG